MHCEAHSKSPGEQAIDCSTALCFAMRGYSSPDYPLLKRNSADEHIWLRGYYIFYCICLAKLVPLWSHSAEILLILRDEKAHLVLLLRILLAATFQTEVSWCKENKVKQLVNYSYLLSEASLKIMFISTWIERTGRKIKECIVKKWHIYTQNRAINCLDCTQKCISAFIKCWIELVEGNTGVMYAN